MSSAIACRALPVAAYGTVAGLALILHAGTLFAPVTMDDVLVTVENHQSFDLANLPRSLVDEIDWLVPEDQRRDHERHNRSGLYRPFLVISYTWDALIHDQDVVGWRSTNLLLHLVASLLVLASVRRLFGSLGAGLVAGLIFAAHPVHVEAILSLLGGRAELLAAVFVLAGWYAFMAGDGRTAGTQRLFDGLSAVFFLCGLMSKENGAVLPAILLIGGWTLRGQRLRPLLLRLVPHGLALATYVGLRLYAVGALPPTGAQHPFRDLSTGESVLGVMTVMGTYLRLIVLPYPVRHPHCYDDLPHATPVPLAWLAALVVIALVAASVWAIRRHRPGPAPVWAAGALLFFVALLPVAHIIPFAVLMAPRFLYLPSIFFCAVAGWGITRAAALRPWLPATATVAATVILIGLTTVTIAKWTDLDRLYAEAASCNPTAFWPHNNRGTAHLRAGRPGEALVHFARAAEIAPREASPRYNLGLAHHHLGRAQQAEQAYRTAIALDPNHSMALNNLAAILMAKGNLEEAALLLERAITAEPRDPSAHVNLGNLLGQLGRLPEAEQAYRTALKRAPRLTAARFNLARLLEGAGRRPEAEALYREILAREPGHAMAMNNLGNIARQRRDTTAAERWFRAALVADPRCRICRRNLEALDAPPGGSSPRAPWR